MPTLKPVWAGQVLVHANLETSPSRLPDDAVHLRRKILLSMHFPFSQWGELPCLHLSNRRIGRGGGRGGVVLLFYLSLFVDPVLAHASVQLRESLLPQPPEY